MKKASVNWTLPEDRPVKPRTPIPSLHVGGLPPPFLGRGPKRPVKLPESHPCPIPPPRPPPRSLLCPSKSASVESNETTRPVMKSQRQIDHRCLVPPTSAPPDICRVSRTRFQTSLQHWTTAKLQYEQWLKDLLQSIGPASQIWEEFGQQRTFAVVVTQLLSHIGPSTLHGWII